MKLTKDECRILESALEEYKYKNDYLNQEDSDKLFQKLTVLQQRLDIAGKDERRNGRKSHNSFTDCLKRYARS